MIDKIGRSEYGSTIYETLKQLFSVWTKFCLHAESNLTVFHQNQFFNQNISTWKNMSKKLVSRKSEFFK